MNKIIILSLIFLLNSFVIYADDFSDDVEELFILTSQIDYQNRPFMDEAGKRFAAYGTVAAETLTKFLDTENARYRKRILDMYKKIGPVGAASLLPFIGKGKLKKQLLVILALGETKDTGSLPVLHRLLSDTNWKIRNVSLMALAKIHNKKSVKYILPNLGDTNLYVRKTAAYALGEIGDTSTILKLIPLLNDPDYPPRFSALRSIAKMDTDTLLVLLENKRYERYRYVPIFYFLLSKLTDVSHLKKFLLEGLSNPNPAIRGYCYRILKKIKTPEKYLKNIYNDKDPWIRYLVHHNKDK